MTNWLDLGGGGALSAGRIVAVSRFDSAPIRRMVEAVGRDRVVNLTYGRPRQSVVVLDSGHVAVVSIAPDTLLAKLKEVEDDVLEA